MLKLNQLLFLLGLTVNFITFFFSFKVQAEKYSSRWSELEANPPRSVNNTLILIKELQEYYKNSTDRDDKLRRQSLDELIWVAKLEPEKCSEESSNKFLGILDLYAYDTVNLKPFVQYHKKLIRDYCEGKNEGRSQFSTDSRNWQQMFDLVFKSEGSPLGNEETLNLLKKLVDMQKDDLNSANVEMREKLTRLVKLSELSKDNCTKEYVEEIVELGDKFEYDTLNIQPYITYWMDKRKELCKDTFKQKESKSTPMIIITDRQELRDLYDKVFSIRSKEEFGNETSQVLRQLFLSYRARNDRSSRRRAAKLERLVKLQELDSDERCNRTTYDELVELYDEYEFHKTNIIPYFNSRKAELAKLCDNKLEPNIFQSDPNEWKNLHKKVYASDKSEGEPVGHAKTLEMLQILHELYSDRTGQRFRQRKEKVEKLIAASELRREKCNRRYRSEMEDLIAYNSLFSINILPYLENAQLQQSKICRS